MMAENFKSFTIGYNFSSHFLSIHTHTHTNIPPAKSDILFQLQLHVYWTSCILVNSALLVILPFLSSYLVQDPGKYNYMAGEVKCSEILYTKNLKCILINMCEQALWCSIAGSSGWICNNCAGVFLVFACKLIWTFWPCSKKIVWIRLSLSLKNGQQNFPLKKKSATVNCFRTGKLFMTIFHWRPFIFKVVIVYPGLTQNDNPAKQGIRSCTYRSIRSSQTTLW